MSDSEKTVRPKSPAEGYGSSSSTDHSDGSRRTSDEEKAVEAAAPVTAPKLAGGEPPDGGWAAWSVVVGVWCISFCSFGWVNSIGTFQEYYANVLFPEYSTSTISWITSLQIFMQSSLGPIVGMFYDRYGPRWVILVGSFLHVFGILMVSLSSEFYQVLLAQGVCSAIGVSAIFQPSMNALNTWFGKRRGMAFGIVATGSSIGAVIFPIMTTQLIRRMGYPWAMRVCAFMILALLVVANLTCRSRTPPHPQVYTREKFKRPFREAEFVLVAVGFLVLTWGVFVPINYLPSQAVALGLRADIVQYLVPILNAASLFGRVTAGVASDRYGRFNVFSILCSLSGVVILALWIPVSNEAGTVAFAAIYGFTSGAYISLMAPVVMQISPLAEIGLRSGLTFCVTSIAGVSTNPISGALLELPTGWLGVKIFGGIMCIAGTLIVFMARIHRTGLKLRAVF